MKNGVWVRELFLLMLMHQFVCSWCGTHPSTATTPSVAVLDNDALVVWLLLRAMVAARLALEYYWSSVWPDITVKDMKRWGLVFAFIKIAASIMVFI